MSAMALRRWRDAAAFLTRVTAAPPVARSLLPPWLSLVQSWRWAAYCQLHSGDFVDARATCDALLSVDAVDVPLLLHKASAVLLCRFCSHSWC
jgi:hypothetical protein